jgi:hypothetical protein
MGIKLYKIIDLAEVDSVANVIEEGLRWNYDNTQCIVEFTSTPTDMDGILTYEEILPIANNFPWTWDTGS